MLQDTHKQTITELLVRAKTKLSGVKALTAPSAATCEAEIRQLMTAERSTLSAQDNARLSDNQIRNRVLDRFHAMSLGRLAVSRHEASQAVAAVRPQLDRVRRAARRRAVPEPTVERPDSFF